MKTQRHIPSLCVEETKAGSILTAMSINSTSLAKADLWGGYIFGRKFSASATLWHGLNFQVCLVPKNQLGGRVILSLEAGTHCVCSIAHHVSYYIWSDALRPPKSDQARLRLFLLTPLPVAPLESLDISKKETAYESSGESKTKSRRRIDECQLIS